MALPLQGLRLLDLSRQLPGPFCSMMLADLGMEVVVIAAPDDPLGAGVPLIQRNKRSLTLNLKTERGRDVFYRLAAGADVVLEGSRPGVAKRLGIDYETLRERNPRLIYCSISGYGQDGPYRDVVGHDINYIGYAGILSVTGPAGGAPVIPGVQIGDIGGGALMAAVGILTAIIGRQTTGEGQFVDVAMMDGSVAWNVVHALLHFLRGREPRGGETQLTGQYPCYAVYETRDAKYVTVGALEPHFWRNLCERLGFPDCVEEQYPEGARREEMLVRFRGKFREKTRDEWIEELRGVDICFGPVNTIEEMARDPQVAHREMVVTVRGGKRGPLRVLGNPIKLSATPGSIRTPPPSFGEHTEEILGEVGYSASDVGELRAAGVV
ncbi:MAG: CaiB/BaiF CoA transferase family protein [Candidatus Binatia bacterium]